MSRDHLILNQSGVYQFKELEMLVIEHLRSTGYVLNVEPRDKSREDAVHVGNMIFDLILLAENLGLDFTACLAAAYAQRTGANRVKPSHRTT